MVTKSERQAMIDRYAEGPTVLRIAFDEAPERARKWRSTDGDWSVHEIIAHCADSEAYAAIRIRLLADESSPMIVGYDQEQWARTFDYHSRPLEPAFAVIESVRASTTELIKSFDDDVWSSVGTHTETGRYSAEDWLTTYSQHLHDHAAQIRANITQWLVANDP